jgi:thioredoxin-related protein
MNVKKCILALFIAAFVFISAASAQEKSELDVGDRVTNFKTLSLSGKELYFEKDILSSTSRTMIFFMTTACSACFEELKDISEFVKDNRGKLTVWAVAVDLRGAKTVRPYADTYNFEVDYILDPKFKLPRLFGFSYTPSFVLVDPEGKILYKKGGFTAGENVKGIIRKFVK